MEDRKLKQVRSTINDEISDTLRMATIGRMVFAGNILENIDRFVVHNIMVAIEDAVITDWVVENERSADR